MMSSKQGSNLYCFYIVSSMAADEHVVNESWTEHITLLMEMTYVDSVLYTILKGVLVK